MLETIIIPPNVFTAVSESALTAVRLHNLGSSEILLIGSATDTTPTGLGGAVRLLPGETLLADVELASLFPSIAGGSMYLFAFSEKNARLSVSHA